MNQQLNRNDSREFHICRMGNETQNLIANEYSKLVEKEFESITTGLRSDPLLYTRTRSCLEK